LRRIRLALGLAPRQTSTPDDLSRLPDLGAVLPPIAPDDLVTRFEQESAKVGASAHRIRSRSEIGSLLLEILKSGPEAGVVLSRNPLLARLDLEAVCRGVGVPAWTWPSGSFGGAGNGEGPGSGPSRTSSPGHDYRERCFSAAAGITGVDFALAESGTLVLSSLTEGSQLSSLAPPIHIAFYLRSQVVGSLEEVLAGLQTQLMTSDRSPARSIVFVTGTSRTADIEQILIRGVHGPREVHPILVED